MIKASKENIVLMIEQIENINRELETIKRTK